MFLEIILMSFFALKIRNNCCDRESRAAFAQSFAPWQQATMEIMIAISLTIACSRYIYNGVILHAHPVRGESHNQRNTTGEVATTSPPFYNQPQRSHVLCLKAELGMTSTSWPQHHFFIDVSLTATHKHELWIWFPLSYAMMKALLSLAAVWDIDKGFERWHCTIYCLEFCAGFNDAKRQHLSTINANSGLFFTTIQKQTYRRKQSMDQSDDNLAHGTTDEKRSSKVPWDRKYIHRKASRKTHSTNGVNIESRVTYNAVWTCERFVSSRMAQWAVYYKALVPVSTYLSI